MGSTSALLWLFTPSRGVEQSAPTHREQPLRMGPVLTAAKPARPAPRLVRLEGVAPPIMTGSTVDARLEGVELYKTLSARIPPTVLACHPAYRSKSCVIKMCWL